MIKMVIRKFKSAAKIAISLAAIYAAAFILQGCSAITVPKPEEIIDHPLGTEAI